MKYSWIFVQGHEYCNFLFLWHHWNLLIFYENSFMVHENLFHGLEKIATGAELKLMGY